MSRERGFTLIEVLVALAIVTIGMSALLGAMTSAADSSLYLRDKTFAEWIALNHIAETRLKFQRPTKGKTDGEVEYAGRRWRWEQEVLETQVPGMLRIDVRVRPAEIPATEKGAWYTTTSGVTGDAVAQPVGDIPELHMPVPGQDSPQEPGGSPTPGKQPPGAQPPGSPPPNPDSPSE
jgi:general secretion pathway protein I